MDIVNPLGSETPSSVHLMLCFPRFSVFMALTLKFMTLSHPLTLILVLNSTRFPVDPPWNMDGWREWVVFDSVLEVHVGPLRRQKGVPRKGNSVSKTGSEDLHDGFGEE